ncbi:ORF6 [Jasmine virus A-1]|nr:ORF6 [Jasmine virus A-1]
MDLEDRFDEEIDIGTRASSPRFVQVSRIPMSQVTSVRFDFTNRDYFGSIGLILSLRFSAGKTAVIYQFNCEDTSGHSIRQTNAGFFSSLYNAVDRPRRIPVNRTCDFTVFKDGSTHFLSIFGWRTYSINSSFNFETLEISISVPLIAAISNLDGELSSNYFEFKQIIENFSYKAPSSLKIQRILNYQDVKSKISKPLIGKREILLTKDFNDRVLEIGPAVDKNIEELPDISDSENVIDSVPVIRFYNVYTLESKQFSSVVVTATLNPLKINEVESNLQYWFGTRKNMIEAVLEYRHDRGTFKFRMMYRKNNKATFLNKADHVPNLQIDSNGTTKVVLGLKILARNIFEVILNERSIGKFKIDISDFKFEYGYEFQIYKSHLGGRPISDILPWKDYGVVLECKVDNIVIDLKPLIMVESDMSKDLRKMSINEAVSCGDVKTFEKLLRARKDNVEESQPIKPVTDDKKSEEELNVNIEITKPFNLSKSLVGIRYGKLSEDQAKALFEKALDYYERKGLNRDDAKVLIYQMAVSFCTSKNSALDTGAHLEFEDKRKEVKKFFKHHHVRMLNSLTTISCNVERLLMRSRSDEILQLLREKVLMWPFSSASRRGIKPELAYLACDFFDLKTSVLSEQELLALNSAQYYVQMRNKHKRTIVNVNQLH